jgi:hypothetical protein
MVMPILNPFGWQYKMEFNSRQFFRICGERFIFEAYPANTLKS